MSLTNLFWEIISPDQLFLTVTALECVHVGSRQLTRLCVCVGRVGWGGGGGGGGGEREG